MEVRESQTLKATVELDKENSKKISDKFIGIFFEDINYGADGGLYAELIRNRDFEFSSADRKEWTSTTGWDTTGDVTLEIATENPIHANNAHYAVISRGAREEPLPTAVLTESS